MGPHLSFGAIVAITIVAVVGLFVWVARTAPRAADRFEVCMGLAEEAGLLATRADDAALICLHNATRPRGGGTGEPPSGVTVPGTRIASPELFPKLELLPH